jgi:hypothetical protein
LCRIVRYVTGETTLRDANDVGTAPEKMLVDKEKELLEKYKVTLSCVSDIYCLKAY